MVLATVKDMFIVMMVDIINVHVKVDTLQGFGPYNIFSTLYL